MGILDAVFADKPGQTPQDVEKRRRYARALLEQSQNGEPVRHWAQGMNKMAQALVGGYQERKADEQEATQKAEANSLLANVLLGGGAPASSTAAGPAPSFGAASSGSAAGGGFPASLIQTESGGNWGAKNDVTGAGGHKGHFGRLQFGQARLEDAMRAGAIPQGTTPQAFMADPNLQMAAEKWHFGDIDNFIAQNGLDRFVGQNVGGVPVTQDGMRAVAHLGGTGGLKRFLESGGQYNPADAYGTSLSDYLRKHGGAAPRPAPAELAGTNPDINMGAALAAGAPAPAPSAGGDKRAQIAALLSNPYTAEIGQQLLMAEYQRANQPPPAPEYQFITAPDGTLIRADKTSGGIDTLGQFAKPEAAPEQFRTFEENGVLFQENARTGERRVLREGQKPATPTELSRLIQERDALPEGDPRRTVYDQAITREAAGSGMVLETAPDGSVRLAQGVGSNFKFTEAQSKDNVFTTRATGALEVLDKNEAALTQLGNRALDMDPTGIARGNLQSDEYQLARQSADEFLQAILRKDTGAAITPQEQELYGKTYLPQPGDNEAVIAQKKAARARAIEAIKAGMSPSQMVATERALAAAPNATPAPQPEAASQGTPEMPEGARQAPDGKWYVPDPNRPGKYLRVEQ